MPTGLLPITSRGPVTGNAATGISYRDVVDVIARSGVTLTPLIAADGFGPMRGAIAKATRGDLAPSGLRRISLGMSPYAQRVAERLTVGAGEWTPGGPEGWPDYNLARIPDLIRRDLTFDEAREFNSRMG